MSQLICDRPRFVRITAVLTAHLAEREYSCPVCAEHIGEICAIAQSPCEVYVAQPFDDFFTVAKKTGRDEQKLMRFNNGGVIYPSRRIYLY